MSVNEPHESRRGRKPGEPGRRGNPLICNATNRQGERCGALAVKGRTKCRHHGGKSLQGASHPNYKHGRYSKDPIERYHQLYAEWIEQVYG